MLLLLTCRLPALLCFLEQLWIAFQMLHGVAQAHSVGACHGDIKAENVLVTSWNWVFLADFAPYKPTYLPADNPVSALPTAAVCMDNSSGYV